MTAPTAKDLLDDVADRAVAGLAVDARAVLAAAGERRRTAVARRAVLVAASVAALLVVALSMLPAVRQAAPQPADRPTGPGGIPRTLYLPPPWTPSITEQPISRAVYLASAPAGTGSEEEAGIDVPTPPERPWLVGADGGQYRLLPETVDNNAPVALSPSGTLLVWAADGRYGPRTRLVVLDVRTGDRRDVELPGAWRRGLSVSALAVSPDERSVAVLGAEPRLAGSMERGITRVDLRDGTLARVCTIGAGGFPTELAWLTRDRLVADRDCTGTPGGGVTVERPPAPPADLFQGYSPLQGGADGVRLVLSPDGRARYDVARAQAETAPVRLVTGGAARGDVPLGDWSGAVVLGAAGDGVVLARWRDDPAYPSGAFGPSDVARVDPRTGTVSVLTASDGVVPRVVAAAADVVARGVPADGVEPGPRVLDLSWWSWWTGAVTGTVLGWLTGLPVVVWPLLAAGGYLVVARRIPVVVRTTGFVLGVLAVVGWLALPFVVPDVAAPAPRPAGDRVVLPRVLQDVRLVPPRAFDAEGEPRTTRVGLVYSGSLGGRDGLYGTDAATGTWVRLDDVPGIEREALFDPNGAVSPSGRYVLVGVHVVDLETARVRTVDLDTADNGFTTSGISDSTAVLDDGTVVATPADGEGTLRVAPPGAGRAGRVAAVTDVSSVQALGGSRVLVRFFGGASGDEPEDLTSLVDLSTTPPVVTALGAEQQAPVAVLGSTLVRPGPDGLTFERNWEQDKADPLGEVEPVAQPGATDAVWLAPPAGPGVLVTLGSTPDADLAVVRTPLAGGAGTPEPLTRVEVGRLVATDDDPDDLRVDVTAQVLTLAPGVVAAAMLVDVPAEPWWSWIQERIR